MPFVSNWSCCLVFGYRWKLNFVEVDADCIGALRLNVVALNPMQKVLRQPCLAVWASASQSLAGVLNVAVSPRRRLN